MQRWQVMRNRWLEKNNYREVEKERFLEDGTEINK